MKNIFDNTSSHQPSDCSTEAEKSLMHVVNTTSTILQGQKMNQLYDKSESQIELQRVNLECGNQDQEALHSLGTMQIREQDFCADVTVFDLSNILVTAAANQLMAALYILPGFVVRKYAIQYQESLIRRLAKGKHAGCLLISKSANLWIPRQAELRGICAVGFTLTGDENSTTALCICTSQELLNEEQNAPAPDSILTLRRLVTELLETTNHE
jgi:hypothetical protein